MEVRHHIKIVVEWRVIRIVATLPALNVFLIYY